MKVQELLLFNSSFSNLAGILCAGYFIHQLSLPILGKAKNPEKNIQSVFIGYLMVFMTYVIVGCFGYFAFAGSNFESIYQEQSSDKGIINQNFLQMYRFDQVPAILVRLLIYI